MPRDYPRKLTNYIDLLGRYARGFDPSATYKDYPARETAEEESVFRYHDSATSRAGLSAVSAKLMGQTIAIVGLGGTGSYIRDLVAKSPVDQIPAQLRSMRSKSPPEG